jgi:hypothetical protein
LKIQIIIPIKSRTPKPIPTGKTQRGHLSLSELSESFLPAFSNPSPVFLTPWAEASPVSLVVSLTLSESD